MGKVRYCTGRSPQDEHVFAFVTDSYLLLSKKLWQKKIRALLTLSGHLFLLVIKWKVLKNLTYFVQQMFKILNVLEISAQNCFRGWPLYSMNQHFKIKKIFKMFNIFNVWTNILTLLFSVYSVYCFFGGFALFFWRGSYYGCVILEYTTFYILLG